MAEKVRQIIETMDKPDYTPKMQNYSELDTIYEPDLKDIQPYLFRVSCNKPLLSYFDNRIFSRTTILTMGP